MSKSNPGPYLTIPEAATCLRVSRCTIDTLLRTGALPRTKRVGGRTMVHIASVQAFMARATRQMRHRNATQALRNRPAGSKQPPRVPPGTLRAAGERLIEGARGAPHTTRAALDFRDGLLLVLLAHCPARTTTLAAIRHGIELDLGWPEGRLSWTGAQTKNNVDLSLVLPLALTTQIREFWGAFRPLLADTASGAHLWLGLDGQPLSAARLRAIMKCRTEQLLGERTGPRLSRTGRATTVATELLEPFDDGQALLGQRAPRSRNSYAAQTRSILAQRHRRMLETEARNASGGKHFPFRSPPRA